MDTLLLAPLGNESIAGSLARLLESETGDLELRQFPDGETHVRIGSDPTGRPVILVRTLNHPDAKLLSLLFTADAARGLGATRVGMVCPYLAYMRQDVRFESGEAVTSAGFARLLSLWFDWLVTVDPHLHRLISLTAIYSKPALVVHAGPLIADRIRAHIERPLLVGPDGESTQWVAAVAGRARTPHIVLKKVRRGDRDVEVAVPEVSRWPDHTPILIDHIVSTARTVIETVKHLRRARLAAPVCIGVHAVPAGDAETALRSAGAAEIVTCNTIAHHTNRNDISGLIAEAVREQLSAGAGTRIQAHSHAPRSIRDAIH